MRKLLTQEQKQQIVALKKKGKTITQVSKILNVSFESVRYYFKTDEQLLKIKNYYKQKYKLKKYGNNNLQ